MADCAANTGSVAPHHLCEVTPGLLEVGVVVGIQPLLIVPTVSSGAGELDPFVVVAWCRSLGGEVAARAHLYGLADGREEERNVRLTC